MQMMPNLGQGGCQAIEDAFVLCDELCDITGATILILYHRCPHLTSTYLPLTSTYLPHR